MEKEVKLEEEQIMTAEEIEDNLKKVYDKFDCLKSVYGKIRYNKIFFGTCNGVSLGSGAVGIGLLFVSGLTIAPWVAAVFGLGGTIYSAVQLKKQVNYQDEVNAVWNENVDKLHDLESQLGKVKKKV